MDLLFLQWHDQSPKHYKGIDIYYIGYITIKKIGDCENIYSVNPFYLLVNLTSGYTEEKNTWYWG